MHVHRPDRGAADLVTRKDFDGVVHMQALKRRSDDSEIEVLAVFFDAGGRTRPHTHSTDQELHVIEGRGVVATETERLIVEAGDILIVPAGTWHWHGATPNSAMSHVSSKASSLTDWDVPEKNWANYMSV